MGNECFKAGEEETPETRRGTGGGSRRGSRRRSSHGGPVVHDALRLFSFERPARPRAATVLEPSQDPADYTASKIVDGEFIRLPGQIGNQQVTVEECTNTKVVLADNCDSVQVNGCTGCTIFIGPTTRSVALHRCSGCTIVAICATLRARACEDCRLGLFTTTRPVLEDSKSIAIGCYAGPYYFDLAFQMTAARMSVMWNHFAHVHDKTPGSGNFQFLPRAESAGLIPSLSELTGGQIDQGEEDMVRTQPPMPTIIGSRERLRPDDAPRIAVAVFAPGSFDKAETAVQMLSAANVLIQTEERKFHPDSLPVVEAAIGSKKAKPLMHGASVVVSYISGRDTPSDNAVAQEAHVVARGGQAMQMHRAVFEEATKRQPPPEVK